MTIAPTEQLNGYTEACQRRIETLRGQEPAWLRPLRQAAAARFAELGFPTQRHEAWRYTDVRPIADTTFTPAEQAPADASLDDLRPNLWDADAACRLVLLNGRFVPGLSAVSDLPDGVRVSSLLETLRTDADAIAPHLARHATDPENAFTALNTALHHDGACIQVPRGVVLDRPIHVVCATMPGAEPVMTHPRMLVVAAAESQVTVVESHIGLGDGPYFANTVTEIVTGDNAHVDHYKVVREGAAAYHIGTIQTQQQRDSQVRSHALAFGGKTVRNDINARLAAPGANCTLNGLYVLRDREHVDNHLRVEHIAPHCDSRENFKGILDDRAHAGFTGRIVVHEDAQKTDGKQSNMTLLLSENARVDTRPQLEIFADDVKCTHGATVGQIDREALFYLRSRGLSEPAARSLLVYAFASEVLDAVRVAELCRHLHGLLSERLPGGAAFHDMGA